MNYFSIGEEAILVECGDLRKSPSNLFKFEKLLHMQNGVSLKCSWPGPFALFHPCRHCSSRCSIRIGRLRNWTNSPYVYQGKCKTLPTLSRAMPCSSTSAVSGGGNENSSVGSFKLNPSTFLASLMPKKEICADRFLESHPNYDGRGALIAIFDSGVDPAAAGLQVTSNGEPKILDVVDCTGSGDVDMSRVVKADANGSITGASGASLIVNPSWKNPSGEWHVGCKLVYELFTDTLSSRIKKDRKKKWDEKNQEAIAKAVKDLDEFNIKYPSIEDCNLKKVKEDLQNKVDLLRKQTESYDDKGPIIDAVVWHDGESWRASLDTQSLDDDSESGKLADFTPLTNYRNERKFGVFSKLDACSVVLNIYEEGNVLSIVTDASPHGTHVAGIAAAFHKKEPLLNGIAPGAQLISCKIGDSRLGSMETGTGLTRALIVAIEHKCDLINMSYGEPALLPDYGRFVDLVNKAVNKHRLIFISSAGNSGPALSTVGAPGGTTSSIIGIGAYVSPEMAAGAHCVVEPPSEGLEYTWSSRGPTVDGDLGVCVSAPGGAVAPVPTWTLQRRMLMNGTSMASPSACGGMALLVSAMKAEGIPVSPYSVRKAVENTCTPIGSVPEDKLSSGQGLMQVDKAYEYIQLGRDLPCVSYEIKVVQSGKTTPRSRGIYLRDASFCNQPTEWTVQVEPKFHEGASNLDDLVPFEECIELHSTDIAVVKAPEYVLLTCNGRTFNVVVDPTKLSDGLHYYEVYGIDSKAPWRGPIFRIPITLTKPIAVLDRLPLVVLPKMPFLPGHIERRFIEVPRGSNWVEATMRTTEFDTTRRIFVDAVQISPLQRPITWESVVTFSSPGSKKFVFPVVSGLTLELTVAQFWSSGIGSHERTVVDFEMVFYGINTDKEEIVLDGSDAAVRIEAATELSSQLLSPVASLNKIRIPFRPIHAKLHTLSANRDRLPSGKQTLALTLTYKFKLEDGADVQPQIPLLNDRIYDTKFESQMYMIYDANKRVYGVGDAYPGSLKLPKGDYNLMLYIRHDNVQLLEKLKQLVLFVVRKLDDKDAVQLSFFSEPDGCVLGNGAFKSSVLIPGKKEALYLAPPSKDKLPKNCPEGSVLLGSISYGRLSNGSSEGKNSLKDPVSHKIYYIVPPKKGDENKGKDSAHDSQTVSELLEEEVRDAKIKVFSGLKQETEEEQSEWIKLAESLKKDYPTHTPLLAKILHGVVSRDKVEKEPHHYEDIIDAANMVIDSIDTDELSRYFSMTSDTEDEDAEKTKKLMETRRDQLAEALYQKGIAILAIEDLRAKKEEPSNGEGEPKVVESDDRSKVDDSQQADAFDKNFIELRKWADVTKPEYGTLLVLRERRCGRLGTALKVLNEIIQEDEDPPKKKFYELKLSLLEKIGWEHFVAYEKQWMHVRFPPSLPLF